MLGDLERSRRLYQTLLLPDFSGVEEVRQAYKSLALKYHPDKNLNDPSAVEKFRDVRLAYEILSNAERKQKYDCNLRLFKPLSTGPFAPGARTSTARAARTAEATGGNPYMSAGNATSNVYDELNSYTARRTERQTRRTASVGAMQDDRVSQYTQEQMEFFKRREREHKIELRRRREQEKREQHARELEALRREQERREEMQQRIFQHSVGGDAHRSHSSTTHRRPSPFMGSVPEQRATADTCKEVPTTVTRGSRAKVKLSDTLHSTSSPRSRTLASDLEMSHLERVRREKERQAEVRRAEQERYLTRLMKRRISEARLRTQEAKEEEERERRKQQNMLIVSETSEREQFLVPQERLERRHLWLQHKQGIQYCWLGFQISETVVIEARRRGLLDALADVQFKVLHLQAREAWGRAVCYQDVRLAWENLMTSHTKIRDEMRVQEQANLERDQRMECHLLFFQETLEFGLIEVQRQEADTRLQVMKEYRHQVHMIFVFLQKLKEHSLLKGSLTSSRSRIAAEEQLARAILWVVMDEWIGRRVLRETEERDLLQLIKQRACERHAKHLVDLQRVQLAERQAHAATISALQLEIQRLKLALLSTFIHDPQAKEECELLATASCPVDSLRVHNITAAIPQNDAGDACLAGVDMTGDDLADGPKAGA